jgi:hypothetical protein
MVSWAHQSDGILINRHAALPGLPPVFPEMRPDTAIRTGQQTRHWHGYGDPPEDDRWYQRLDPDTAAGEAHLRKHHAGGNCEEVHLHDDLAKYIFPPAPTRKKKPQVRTPTTSHTGCPPIAPSAISTQMLWRPKSGADGTSRSIMAVWT